MNINTDLSSKQILKRLPFHSKLPGKDGILLRINHKSSLRNQTGSNQCIRFIQACFNCTGILLAVANHNGNIFIFDLDTKKHWLLASIHCSVMKFASKQPEVLFVGINLGLIYVLDVHHGQVIGNLVGHSQSVTDMDFIDEKCASLSGNEAIVWNLKKFEKIQVFRAEEDNHLKIVKFVPGSKNILGCFQNDAIHVWSSTNYQLMRVITPIIFSKVSIRTVAFSCNGELMIIAGHSPSLFVFLTSDWTLLQRVNLIKSVHSIKKIEFLRDTKILTVLLGNGIIYFYNLDAEMMIGKISNEIETWKFSLDPSSGLKVACVMRMGEVLVYSLVHLTKAASPLNNEPKHSKKGTKFINRYRNEKVEAVKKQLENVLDVGKLKAILGEFGEFPELYRKVIWTHILRLPNDIKQYETVLSNIYESPFSDFEKNYPLENKQDLKNLKRTIQALVSWCRFFQSVQYLPNLVFPFVKLFENEPVLTFETLIMIIVNYCQYFFEYHPLPPLNILGIIENNLMQTDPQVLTHFNNLGINSKIYAWPLLQTLFSEVLPASQWLVFWDHVITNEPAFLILAVVSFTITNRTVLLARTDEEEISLLYKTLNAFDFKQFLAKTYKLLGEKREFHPRKFLEDFKPFENGFYPKFNSFPVGYLEVADSLRNLRQERAEIEEEERVLRIQNLDMPRIKEIERKSEENLRKSQINFLFAEKVNNEKLDVENRRERLRFLRDKIKNEQDELIMIAKTNFLRKTGYCWDRENNRIDEKVLEEGPLTIDNNKTLEDVENQLLQRYTNLLRHKLKIQGLIEPTCQLDCVRNKTLGTFCKLGRKTYQKQETNEETKTNRGNEQQINKQKLNNQTKEQRPKSQGKSPSMKPLKSKRCQVNTQEYLKQLNVATGLAAIDSLIGKVESQILHQRDESSNEEINKLVLESKDLSQEIAKLMFLIKQHKP